MSAELDTSHFPIPKEVQERLKDLEQRLIVLEKDKVRPHTMGNLSALSVNFSENYEKYPAS